MAAGSREGLGKGGLGLDWVDLMDVDRCTNLKQWKVGEKKILRKIDLPLNSALVALSPNAWV